MAVDSQLKNRIIAKVITRFPSLAKRFTDKVQLAETTGKIPWTPLVKGLADGRLSLVRTCGVHHASKKSHDMKDPDGDPSFRTIELVRLSNDRTITHDSDDHADADKNINIVFPIKRLKEFKSEGGIREVGQTHFGFMGHLALPQNSRS